MNTIFKNLTSRVLLLCCTFVLSSGIASAQSKTDIELLVNFQESNRLFADDRNFEEALTRYLEIIEEKGISENLAFNVASCYYNLGENGLARLYLEKVLAINPQNPDAQNNLRIVIEKLNIEERTHSTVEIIAQRLSSNTWFIIGTLFLLLSISIIVRHAYKRSSITAGKQSTTSILLTLLLLTISISTYILSYLNATLSKCGIVVSEEANLRTSPFETSELVAILSEGKKLKIIQHRENYFKVTDSNEEVLGWVSDASFRPILILDKENTVK